MVKKLTLRTKFKLSTLSDDEIQHIVDDTRKRNGKINYANTGRHFGVDAKTVKDEIIRRNMTWLENSPD
jgi:hypothetical protein